MASHPAAARVLTLLELLQTHGRMSGGEIATRLGVDRRTVRRYLASLEDLGIPLTTERGAAGGYALVPGYKLPPLMFTNDEVLALAVGLGAVPALGLVDASAATASARAKLERVMPSAVRDRLRVVSEAVAFSDPRRAAGGTARWLPLLSACAHHRRRVHVAYRTSAGVTSERDLDPFGVAFVRGQWYVSGFCHLRQGLRTFRLDRIEGATEGTATFARPDGFDVLRHLATSIALIPRRYAAHVRLGTDLATAGQVLLPELGLLEPVDGQVLLRTQVDDLDWFARELARLPWPFVVLKPVALARAIERRAQALLRAVRPRGGPVTTRARVTPTRRRPRR